MSAFPYYKQLLHKIQTTSSDLEMGLGVGDEVAILDFIQKEVETNLEHIQSLGEESKALISNYRNRLRNDNNIFNKRREQYEQSVGTVTRTITEMMLERQQKAQEMYPHYYEKYKTDLIENKFKPVQVDYIFRKRLSLDAGFAQALLRLERDKIHGYLMEKVVLIKREPLS